MSIVSGHPCDEVLTVKGQAKVIIAADREAKYDGCPPGFTKVPNTLESVGIGGMRMNCKQDDLPLTNRDKATCCLKLDKEYNCPPTFCTGKIGEPNCVNSVLTHCKDNLGKNADLSDECWSWATVNNPQIIDEYCTGGDGTRINSDERCNAFVKDSRSYGKLDKSVKAYCKTNLAKDNHKKGEPLCNCFIEYVKEGDLVKDLGDQGIPECWYSPCKEGGYKTREMIDRVTSGCGNLCAQILKDVDLPKTQSFKAIQDCAGDAAKLGPGPGTGTAAGGGFGVGGTAGGGPGFGTGPGAGGAAGGGPGSNTENGGGAGGDDPNGTGALQGLSGVAIVGIIAGVFVILVLVALIVYAVRSKKSPQYDQYPSFQDYSPYTQSQSYSQPSYPLGY